MRVFTVALALWVDPLWLRNARRSWRVRRYWLAGAHVAPGRWTLHLGPCDVRVRLEGVKRGPERAKGQG